MGARVLRYDAEQDARAAFGNLWTKEEAMEFSQKARIAAAADQVRFVVAGNATFTLRSKRTGAHLTFRVVQPDEGDSARALRFVSVLTGPQNEDDYTFLGTLFPSPTDPSGYVYRHGSKSRIGREAPSARAFAWFWDRLFRRTDLPQQFEFWHEGTCGRCGRLLTRPESIAIGIGPECASRL